MKTLLFKTRYFLAEENRFGRRSWAELPSSILLTAAYLERSGYDVDVRDDEFMADEVFDGYDVAVGWISLADGLYEGLDYLRVAKGQGLRTILVLFDDWEGLSRQVMEDFEFIDYAVRRWDIETTLERLLSHVRDRTSFNFHGVVHRVGAATVLDGGEAIHHPESLEHLLSARSWLERLGPNSYEEFSIRVGSGCPFKCTFCHIGERPNRYRRVVDVIDEIAALPRNAFVRILSADLPQNTEWVNSFCQTLVDRKLQIRWETDSRFTWLQDPHQLKLMRRSGCVELAMGLESYHPEMLKAYKKGYKHELISSGIRNLVAAGITPGLNMMIGHPDESEETLVYTEAFLRELDPEEVKLIGIQFLRPLPGTRIFAQARDLGLIDGKVRYSDFYLSRDEPMLPSLALSKDEIISWRHRLVEAYYQ